MKDLEQQKIIENTKSLLEDKDSIKIIKESIITIKPSKMRVIVLLVILLLILKPIINLSNSQDTIKDFMEIINLSNVIIIPIFAMTFTGFALFQALASKSTLKQLLLNKVEDKSMFKFYNLFFMGINMIYLYIIVLNFILIIALKNIPNSWSIPQLPKVYNDIIACVLISLYISVNLFALTEIKSFLYNIYQCFSLNAASNVIDEIKNNSNDS